MIILWWWIIMNKSLPHFLNGGKCITTRGLQPSDSLGAAWGLSACACVSFEPLVLWLRPTLFSRLYQYKIASVYVTSQSEHSVCVSCSESTSQETWQFTYHIQTAFVLDICHFHSLVARSPLSSLAVSLFSIFPEALALNQPSFYCLFVFNMLAFEKWTLSLTHKKTTAFIFSWWVTSCGHESNYFSSLRDK